MLRTGTSDVEEPMGRWQEKSARSGCGFSLALHLGFRAGPSSPEEDASASKFPLLEQEGWLRHKEKGRLPCWRRRGGRSSTEAIRSRYASISLSTAPPLADTLSLRLLGPALEGLLRNRPSKHNGIPFFAKKEFRWSNPTRSAPVPSQFYFGSRSVTLPSASRNSMLAVPSA